MFELVRPNRALHFRGLHTRVPYAELDLEQPATVPSVLPLLAYGTVYQPTLSLYSQSLQLSRNV